MVAPPADWSLHNLSADLGSAAAVKAFFHSDALVEFYQDCYYAAAGVILLFRILSLVCHNRNMASYRSLEGSARLVYITHWAFFLLFTFTTVPYSFGMLRALFSTEGVMDLVQKSTFRSITFPLAFQLCMYIFEGAFRAVLRINNFLFVHHIMFCAFLVLAFQSKSIFMVKVDIIVSCFATYEFLLYAALISRKTVCFQGWFRWLMISGLSFYLFTRIVQIILLLALFVLAYGPMSHTRKNAALYWVGMIMCIALMALQMYTFVIYKAIWDHTLQTLPVTNKQSAAKDGATSARVQEMSTGSHRPVAEVEMDRSRSGDPFVGETHYLPS